MTKKVKQMSVFVLTMLNKEFFDATPDEIRSALVLTLSEVHAVFIEAADGIVEEGLANESCLDSFKKLAYSLSKSSGGPKVELIDQIDLFFNKNTEMN